MMPKVKIWNPTPLAKYTIAQRKDYHAGYSDGFYRCHYGAGHTNPTATYDRGYNEGRRA